MHAIRFISCNSMRMTSRLTDTRTVTACSKLHFRPAYFLLNCTGRQISQWKFLVANGTSFSFFFLLFFFYRKPFTFFTNQIRRSLGNAFFHVTRHLIVQDNGETNFEETLIAVCVQLWPVMPAFIVSRRFANFQEIFVISLVVKSHNDTKKRREKRECYNNIFPVPLIYLNGVRCRSRRL